MKLTSVKRPPSTHTEPVDTPVSTKSSAAWVETLKEDIAMYTELRSPATQSPAAFSLSHAEATRKLRELALKAAKARYFS